MLRKSRQCKKLAKECLTGAEFGSVINTLDQLDLVRLLPSRIQHDLWAKKGVDNQNMFVIHASEYIKFTTQYIEVLQRIFDDGEKADQIIGLAYQFASSIETG